MACQYVRVMLMRSMSTTTIIPVPSVQRVVIRGEMVVNKKTVRWLIIRESSFAVCSTESKSGLFIIRVLVGSSFDSHHHRECQTCMLISVVHGALAGPHVGNVLFVSLRDSSTPSY